MRVAWLFDPSAYETPYDVPALAAVFQRLKRQSGARLHVLVRDGDLIWRDGKRGRRDLVDALLGRDYPIWHTVESEPFSRALDSHRIYVVDTTGVSRSDVAALHVGLLGEVPSYMGAIEVTPFIPLHWVLFENSIGRHYRLVGNDLRLLHTAFDVAVEDNRDWYRHEIWTDTGLFDNVTWEDVGILGTIFDPADSLEAAQTEARLEALVGSAVGSIANELCLRLVALSPELAPPLLAALETTAKAATAEEAAHASLSLRRFLVALADALLEPRVTGEGERPLTRKHYKNRLIAYVEESLHGTADGPLVSSLEDLGRRLDRLLNVAHEGVHADIAPHEAHRLLLGVLGLVHDMLTLQPPPDRADLEVHAEHLRQVMRQMIVGHAEADE